MTWMSKSTATMVPRDMRLKKLRPLTINFHQGKDRRGAVDNVMKERLFLLVGSPSCTIGGTTSSRACTLLFSILQVADQPGPVLSPRASVDGQVMVHARSKPIEQNASCQMDAGTHVCQYVMVSERNGTVGPVLKPT